MCEGQGDSQSHQAMIWSQFSLRNIIPFCTLLNRKQFRPTAAMSQFIQTAPALRELDISDSKIPPDVLKNVVASMSMNPLLVDLVGWGQADYPNVGIDKNGCIGIHTGMSSPPLPFFGFLCQGLRKTQSHTLISFLSLSLCAQNLSLASCDIFACLPIVLDVFKLNCLSALNLADNGGR